ncbi:tetratricopeptide repeat protein, partial [bacterium]|nr:tetratricopeptide repeat protein [bacterium]
KIIIGFIALLAILAAITALNYQKQSLEQEAFVQLTKAKQELTANQTKEAQRDLEQIIDKFLTTQAGEEAMILISNHYYNNGNYDKCLELNNTAAKKTKNKSRIYPNILMFQAYCYEQKKEYDFAIKRFKKITEDYPNHYLTPDALTSLARCYQSANKKDEAIAAYKLIAQKYADTLWAKNAEEKTEELLKL